MRSFNWEGAIESFGEAFLRTVKSSYRATSRQFAGDWWMLAMLMRCEEIARRSDPDGKSVNRLMLWNDSVVQVANECNCYIHLEVMIGTNMRLQYVNLSKVHLDRASISFSFLSHAKCYAIKMSHTDLSRSFIDHADFMEANLTKSDLSDSTAGNADFSYADLTQTNLSECNLQDSCFIEAKMIGADVSSCNLDRAQMIKCSLRNANLSESSLRNASVHWSNIAGAKIGGADLTRARGLFGPFRAVTREAPVDEHESHGAIYRQPNDFVGWGLLRVIGSLRIFGVSYFSVAGITLYVGIAREYNAFAAHARDVVAELAPPPPQTLQHFAMSVAGRMPDLPVPAHLGRQLVFTILLAIAATIYALACPSEVKEANEVRWTRAMNQPLWEYRSANWSRLVWRYLCALFFVVGGAHSLWYLFSRGFFAASYLLFGI